MPKVLTHTQKTRRLVLWASASLAALLVVIGALMWQDAGQDQRSPAAHPDVQVIRIQRPGFEDIALQRQVDNTWMVIEPCVLPANAQRLEPLLDALTPTVHSYAASDVDLEAAGLIEPAARIFLNEQELRLGQTDLSGERRYVQRGKRVEFAPEWVLSLVNGGLSALATLEVFTSPLDALQIGGLSGSAGVPLASSDSARQSDTGEHAKMATDEELAQWQALNAQQIVPWPLRDAELETDAYPMVATAAGKSTRLWAHTYPNYAAVRYEDAACAYILPLSSIPGRHLR